MKISGIIYHSEWESDADTVSIREEVIVSRFETKDEDYFDRNTFQDTIAAIPGRNEVENHPVRPRGSLDIYDRPTQKATSANSSPEKRDSRSKRNLIDRNKFIPGARIVLPRRKRFKFPRKLFGLASLVAKKSSTLLKNKRIVGFPLRIIGSFVKKAITGLRKSSGVFRIKKVYRSPIKLISATSKGVGNSSKKLLKVLRMFKIGKMFLLLTRAIISIIKNSSKILIKALGIFRIFKVVNKERTSKVLKTSAKYTGKSGKALFKGTKWLTIKTVKLIPPTASLTYRGAKKIKSNDILFRLVVATIAGIIFFATIFARYELL